MGKVCNVLVAYWHVSSSCPLFSDVFHAAPAQNRSTRGPVEATGSLISQRFNFGRCVPMCTMRLFAVITRRSQPRVSFQSCLRSWRLERLHLPQRPFLFHKMPLIPRVTKPVRIWPCYLRLYSGTSLTIYSRSSAGDIQSSKIRRYVIPV